MTIKTFFKSLFYMFSKFSFKTKIILIVLILLFGVYMTRGKLITTHDGYKEEAGTSISPLEREARDIVQKNVFDKVIIKCGDMIYMKTFWNLATGRRYQRFKSGKISIYSTPISEADKMNGVEWRGTVSFDCIGPCQLAFEHEGYGEWKDFGCENTSVGMTKQGGRWNLKFESQVTQERNPITCEEALNPTGR